MKTVSEFAKEAGITMTLKPIDNNPLMNLTRDSWAATANHYRVILRRGKNRLTTYFSTGPGWDRDPELDDILDSLASDAGAFENARDFEDFASEFGYDTDSRKAESIFKTCRQISTKLKRFLGAEGFNSLLWDCKKE